MPRTMIENIRFVINKYFNIISIFFVFATVIMLFFGQAFLNYSLDDSTKISMSFIAVYLGLLGDHLASLNKRFSRGYVKICPNQIAANNHFPSIIKNKSPKCADLIGYSAENLRHIIENLSEQNCRIRLLVHNPDTAISKDQADKIRSQVKGIFGANSNKDLEIKFYDEDASLRGMNFDDKLVNIGWYCYDARKKGRG